MVEALDRALANPKVRFRIGTGEYTDSLVLEPLHGISAHLVKHFAQLNNATLELKTKSDAVGTLLDLDHRGHTVLAWSLNPQQIIDESEPYTASLDERLRAAQAAQAAGYPLAFHLDPIIYHDDWRRLYRELIVELFERIDPAGVVWISLGGFRYSGGHKEVMQSRFPEQRLTAAEMIQGSDGKFRYLKTIRREIYTTLRGWIEERDAKLFHYLCMETQGMWRTIYGAAPGSARELDRHFEERRCEVAARHK